MTRRRDEWHEALFAQLRSELPSLSEWELQSLACAAAAAKQRPPLALGRRRLTTPQRLGLAVAVAAALVLSGALVGNYLTPSGTAGTPLTGLGFLPAGDWTVVQSGTAASGVATAIATNAKLHPDDELGAGVPEGTLRSLPSDGVVIYMRFTTRGDQSADAAFPIRELPLRIGAAALRGDVRVRAGIGVYNIDARIFFGSNRPTDDAITAAQQQLDRLVVAAERVSLFARPTSVKPGTLVTLFGSVDNRQAGERVDVQIKECGGPPFFRVVSGGITQAGGNWTTTYWPRRNTTFRAVWKGTPSSEIVVRSGMYVSLTQPSPGRYRVWVGGSGALWRAQPRRYIVVQRLDRRVGVWKNIKNVRLGAFNQDPAVFRVRVPKGTMLRAFIPASQARPCNTEGYSFPVRAS
jgi:hypothetical protein